MANLANSMFPGLAYRSGHAGMIEQTPEALIPTHDLGRIKQLATLPNKFSVATMMRAKKGAGESNIQLTMARETSRAQLEDARNTAGIYQVRAQHAVGMAKVSTQVQKTSQMLERGVSQERLLQTGNQVQHNAWMANLEGAKSALGL